MRSAIIFAASTIMAGSAFAAAVPSAPQQLDFAGFGNDDTQVAMPVFTGPGTLSAVTVQLAGTVTLAWDLDIEPAPGATLPAPGDPNPVLIPIDFGVSINSVPFDVGSFLWNATADGYSGPVVTMPVSGSFADDPSFYLDPNNPRMLDVRPWGGFATDLTGPGGQFYTVAVADPLTQVDGTLTANFTDPPASVPEPSGSALLAIGALGMGWQARRRQKH